MDSGDVDLFLGHPLQLFCLEVSVLSSFCLSCYGFHPFKV
jgi:hypothetical protein